MFQQKSVTGSEEPENDLHHGLTQSIIITLPRNCHRLPCQNCKTVSFISQSSTFLLKVIFNMLNPQAEEIIAGI